MPVPLIQSFLQGDLATVCQEPDGLLHSGERYPAALLPGSFNPLHEGHLGLTQVAAQRLAVPVDLELSISNVDKPPLSAEEVQRRLALCLGRTAIWLTRAPTFAEKAALFPGVVFVVGADTAVRIVNARYYENSEARMAKALESIRSRGCRFLVAGRVDDAGVFQESANAIGLGAWSDLFADLGAFRCDVSSTALRGGSRSSRQAE